MFSHLENWAKSKVESLALDKTLPRRRVAKWGQISELPIREKWLFVDREIGFVDINVLVGEVKLLSLTRNENEILENCWLIVSARFNPPLYSHFTSNAQQSGKTEYLYKY